MDLTILVSNYTYHELLVDYWFPLSSRFSLEGTSADPRDSVSFGSYTYSGRGDRVGNHQPDDKSNIWPQTFCCMYFYHTKVSFLLGVLLSH